jgi:prolipoprotein diacylglyceryltransferase
MLPVVQVGPAAIPLPGLILLAGVWLATSAVERSARGRGGLGEALGNVILVGLVAGIIGARLGYALRFPEAYLANPVDLISLQPAALDGWSGGVAACLAGWLFGRRKGLALWPALDGLAPGLAVMAGALALSHLASGDAFGEPSSIPWAIDLWGARRHPSQVYELAAAVTGWILVNRLARIRLSPGLLFLGWVGWTAASRLVLEAWRGDSVLIFAGLRWAQVVSLMVLAAALVVMHWQARRESGDLP